MTTRETTRPNTRRWLTLLLAGLLGGCSQPDALARYFPTQPGMVWSYRLQRTTMDGTRERPYYVEHRGPARLASGAMLLEERRTFEGNRYFYRLQPDTGWQRIAVQGAFEETPRVSTEPWLVLPAPLVAGHQWRQLTPVRVLEKTGPPQETLFRVQASLPVDYRIASLDDTVEVPAGTFRGCLRIEGAGRTSVHLGNYLGVSQVEVSLVEWYAPDVGLVKQQLDERTNKQALDHGRLLLELSALLRP